MPIHDWTKTYDGAFHYFHVSWLVKITDALNDGMLPPGYYALGEQVIGGAVPDVLTLRPRVIAIRHRSGDHLVAMVEIVSAGNKADAAEMGALIEKTVVTLSRGVHVVLIDLHPPGPNDPEGIQNLVWRELGEKPLPLPAARPLLCVSYLSRRSVTCFVEPRAVGERLPDMPLFLTPAVHVALPLERTYQATFDSLPAHLRGQLGRDSEKRAR
ncbi:MAG: hypothetical protein HY721_25695 [Planctomycetes bacterium]|nr:hypothetical protein [Planctomycetota bacterium]